jgi:hypothetical protein
VGTLLVFATVRNVFRAMRRTPWGLEASTGTIANWTRLVGEATMARASGLVHT